MKMSKTIIPALAMLVVSAVMLTTASLAWFAMNNSVTAEGMQVNIQSDSLFLYIAAANKDTILDAEDIIGLKQTEATGIPLDDVTDLYPAAYENVVNSADLKNLEKWYTASGLTPDSAAIDDNSKKTLKVLDDEKIAKGETPTGFAGYVARYKYYVTLAKGSQDISSLTVSELKIVATEDGDYLSPVRVVVATEYGLEEFNSGKSSGTVNLLDHDGNEDDGLSEEEVLEIYVYVYYNGNDTNVTTNNLDKIAEATISFKLQTGAQQ